MKKTFLTLAAVATMLAACNNESVPLVDEMTDTPITISAGVAELTSRAGHDAGELKSGSLGFFMTTTGAAIDATRYNATNREVKYENNKWNIQGEQLLWMNTSAFVDYIAYHPYDAAADNETCTINVPQEQTTNNVIDLLYAKGSTKGEESASGIELRMKHVMSKLTVTLRAGTELGAMPTFSKVVLKGMTEKATFDLGEGTSWYAVSSATPIDITMIQNDDLSYEAIVIPQEFKDSEFVVEISTMDNRKFVFRQNNVTLSMGMVYTLNLIVGKDMVELDNAGITVEDWGTPDNWNGSFETE